MSMEEARRLYELIGQDEQLQAEFEGLESTEEVVDKALEIGKAKNIEPSRGDVEALLEEIIEQQVELDDDELENVAGGDAVRAGVCVPAALTAPADGR